MTKHMLAIFVGLVTFVIGCAVVADYYIRQESEVTERAVVGLVPSAECKKPASFPGLSKPLTEIAVYKNGFFPVKQFDDGWHNADEGKNQWYGKFLRSMGEASLLDTKNEKDEVYRFLWLRTFHHPIAVRLERDGYSVKLKAVEFDGAGGYEPGRVLRTDNVSISLDEWCEFIRRLEQATFWQQETVDPRESGNDGSQWILEAVKDQRYHVVDRWTPEEGAFKDACVYLLRLSGRNTTNLAGDLY
jgi:hypothetical protein